MPPDAHPIQWYHRLPKDGALFPIGHPGIRLLLLMVFPHIRRSLPQRFHHRRIRFPLCRLVFLLRHKEVLCTAVHLVDEFRIVKDCLVALAPHIRDDAPDKLRCRKVLAEQLLVGFPDLRVQFHLIKGSLGEQPLHLLLPDILCPYDSHASASLSKISRKSFTMALMRSNFILKLTRLAMSLAVASMI